MIQFLVDMCCEYICDGFSEVNVFSDFFSLFCQWFDDVVKIECLLVEFNVMILVIVDVDGYLYCCIFLFKGFDECGFIFFINYESVKGW